MINSIQILRAIAAFGVFFAHYNLFGIHSGGFGVDIFFIISGFIIAYVVNYSTKNFFIKRVIRVTPLYLIATLVIVFLVLIAPNLFKSVVFNFEALMKSIFYIPYRIDQSGPILSLGWTLNFEMFFYVSMTLCILIFKKTKYLILICSLMLVFFLIILNIFTLNSYPLIFFKEGLLPEFIFGLLLFYYWQFLQNVNLNNMLRFGSFILALLSFVFLIYNDITHDFSFLDRNINRGIPSLIIVAGFMSIEPFLNGKNKIVKFISLIGDSSYAMYLFHPFILFGFTRVVFPLTFGEETSVLIEILKFIIVSISLIFGSILIYKLIDKPLNDYLKKVIVKKRKP